MNKLSKPRKLKVYNVGDFYRKEVILQIRLQGKWLLAAGLQPDTHVQVTNPKAGVGSALLQRRLNKWVAGRKALPNLRY